jgi:FkbM family methyltransferase
MITKEVTSIGNITYTNIFSEDTFLFRHQKFSHIINTDCITLDIGAHTGWFSLLFGSCAKKVLSFEPNPVVFKSLKENSDYNPQFNIIPHQLACTKENKKYIFNYSDPRIYGDGSNGGFLENLNDKNFKKYHTYEQEVDGVNLLEFLNKNYSDDVSGIKFIKIDSEGYDKEILKTIKPLIETNKPILMVEAFKFLTEPELEDYFNVIDSLGYKIYDISPLDNIKDCVGPLDMDEFKYFTYKICENGNFLCVHKDDIKKYNLPEKVKGKTCAVIFGRNDDCKEKERFKIHIIKMLETFDEVIYVDWNSEKQSFLYEIINEIPKTGRLKHFVIEPKIAKILENYDSNTPSCSTAFSFNIGIRRTDAEYIVLTNTDIIPPSKEILQDFINRTNKNTMYSLSRRDIEYKDVINNKDNLNQYIEYLNKNTQPRYSPTKVTPNDVWSLFNGCGDFQLTTKNIWLKIRGYEEQMKYAQFIDTNAQKKSVLYGFELKDIYDVPLYQMSHTEMTDDGKTPNRKYYNNAMNWVEYFDGHVIHEHRMISRNDDDWGFSETEIEYEVI